MNFVRLFFDKFLFSSMTGLVHLGARRSLEANDFPELPNFADPRVATLAESRIDWSDGKRILTTVLFANPQLWMKAMIFNMAFMFFSLCGPVLVNLFVKQVQIGFSTSDSIYNALTIGVLIGLTSILGGLSVQHYYYHFLRGAQIYVNTISRKIFNHSLVLQKQAKENLPVGDLVNHMSSDTDAVSEIGDVWLNGTYCVVMILGATTMLYYYIGASALVAVLILGCLAPLTKKVSQQFTHYDEELMRLRDQRISLMSQILNAIRLIKYFVWEDSVSSDVQTVRSAELTSRKKIARAELLVTLLYVSVGTFVLFGVLVTHVWRGGVLDAALVFTCVSLFALLEDPFAHLSRVISRLISAKVSAGRIANFLKLPTISRLAKELVAFGSVGMNVQNLTVKYADSTSNALNDITINFAPGRSLALVGAVGSGKSTLLNAILQELPCYEGEINFFTNEQSQIDGFRAAYVSQEAFIINGTIRENVLFGQVAVNDEVIISALRMAEMYEDVAQMNSGLDTEIGEKGINLSGGQKQRLCLARAILAQPQLILLDDPLSAVDVHTETQLVEKLIFGHWSTSSRVVATHRLTHLDKFDQIVFLESGRCVGSGSYTELLQNCSQFSQFVESARHQTTSLEGGEEKQNHPSTLQSMEGRITTDEDRAFGAVKGRVYWDYILSLGGDNIKTRVWILAALLFAAASSTLFPLVQKSWLSLMTNSTVSAPSWISNQWFAVLGYGAIGLLVVSATLLADMFWLSRGLKAGKNLHDKMLKAVLQTGVRFFDATPVGRILQRFSRDMEAVDIHLQWSFENSLKCFCQIVVTLILIISVLPVVLIVMAPVIYFYYKIQKLYRASAREAKRLDSIARSPRYAHFKETLNGLIVLRAYGQQQWFTEKFYAKLHFSQRMFFGHYMINRWFSTRIPIIGGAIAMFTTIGIVVSSKWYGLAPGTAGLLTVYSLSFWGVLNWGVRIWAEVEARMTSMERIKHYIDLPREGKTTEPSVPVVNWPTRGEIVFEDVYARYSPQLPHVLRGLSVKINGGSRVGIIGRTGSGKSTLFQTLYRFIELESGRILIDGQNIAQIPLAQLRQALAIIPQDPTLFLGTLRSNLDRGNEYADEAIWQVLKRAGLFEFVSSLPLGLNTTLVENGYNLSQGQRQLLCLARALLLDAKIIVLDEATASVDVQTDQMVQRVLHESCHGRTVLTIAHRLATVRDSDLIIELQNGVIRRELRPQTKEQSRVGLSQELILA